MKKIKYLIFMYLAISVWKVFASDAWVLWWVSASKLRNWDIHLQDIPKMISFAVDFLMWIAWTISIIFIIIWAYKLMLWQLQNDNSQWKETITLAILWLILSSISWIIMKILIDNFT